MLYTKFCRSLNTLSPCTRFKDCDIQTTLIHLEEHCRFHGIPRSIKCDQAPAFEARALKIFGKNKNTKKILALVGDHRATCIVKRLIQALKRRITVTEYESYWWSSDLATIVAKVITSQLPNTTTKIKQFGAHVGRTPNTEFTIIITKQSNKNPSYSKLQEYASDQATLRQPALLREIGWDLDNESEPQPNIQYNV